jgi:hypothetical protein
MQLTLKARIDAAMGFKILGICVNFTDLAGGDFT